MKRRQKNSNEKSKAKNPTTHTYYITLCVDKTNFISYTLLTSGWISFAIKTQFLTTQIQPGAGNVPIHFHIIGSHCYCKFISCTCSTWCESPVLPHFRYEHVVRGSHMGQFDQCKKRHPNIPSRVFWISSISAFCQWIKQPNMSYGKYLQYNMSQYFLMLLSF